MQGAHLFRVVRDTDMVIQEDEADDLLETIDQGLASCVTARRRCCRSRSACRGASWTSWSRTSRSMTSRGLRTPHRIGFGDWMELMRLHRPELKDATFAPRVVWGRSELEEVFERVRHRDYMLHHPFDSFTSVETFLQRGGRRPERRSPSR